MSSQKAGKAQIITIPEGGHAVVQQGDLRVEFSGAGRGLRVGARDYELDASSGLLVPANTNTPQKIIKQSAANDPLHDTGTLIEGEGVYLGTWEPKDNIGRTLGKIFDIYAAPEDIRNGSGNLLMSFNNAVEHVAGLRNYHGYDGGNFANEKAILDAVRNNPAALAQWFLPTKELLHGKTSGGDKIQPANLYDSRNTGAFNNTFITKSGSGNARWYLSLTEHPDDPSYVYNVRFTDGGSGLDRKDNRELYDHELSSRVVLAKLRL
jgi:hypothetical protein